MSKDHDALWQAHLEKTKQGFERVKAMPICAVIYVEPIGKPRATQRDKWKPSDAVLRYRAWADEVRRQVPVDRVPTNPLRLRLKVFFSIPASWSKVKKRESLGSHHRQCPDSDNIAKAVMDTFWKQDSGIAVVTIEKRWDDGDGARIEMTVE